MEDIARFVLICGCVTSFALSMIFWEASVKEGEKRAARIAGLLAGASLPLAVVIYILPGAVLVGLLVLGGVLALLSAILFLLPIGRVEMGATTPKVRHDERDVLFARRRLKPGSREWEAYYAMRPENREKDDAFRDLPGLLSPRSRFADPFLFASADASFFLTESLRDAVDGPLAEERQVLPPETLTAFVKDLAHYYGAVGVGVTGTQPYHIYSHVGRGSGNWGEPIAGEYRYAIALAVKMNFHMVGTAPGPQTVAESARQYVEAARVAVQLAAALRNLGFPSRAHIDGNYRVIAPLVARDAGLGEIGRMGLLMTPPYGPRLRLAVVTTEAPLVPDGRDPRPDMIDFCNICQKCVACCPAQAIPAGPRREIDGALRWRIDSDLCFRYWNTAGTDCARCMAVCPYAHAGGFFHDLVRWGNARSGFFRRLALRMDDLFYGCKPAPRPAPEWTRVREDSPIIKSK